MKPIILATGVFISALTTAQAAEFGFSFNWQGLALCTSGHPNRVGNPEFQFENVPTGTGWIYFELTDLDVPSYPHGGGWIPFDAGAAASPDTFEYQSPCPPFGSHLYEWEARAYADRSEGSPILGVATSRAVYP